MLTIHLPDIDVTDSEPLMHYMPAGYFRTLLDTRSLHAGRMDKQQKDPNHGLLPAANLTEASRQDIATLCAIAPATNDAAANFARSQAAAINHDRRLAYVHSWTMRADEDFEMWKTHGENGRSVCIKTTAKRLKESLGIGPFPGQTINVHGIPVSIELKKCDYRSENSPKPVFPSYFATAGKGVGFRNEREVQVEAHLSIDQALIRYEKSEPPTFQKLPVKFGYLFEAVFMGPLMDDATSEELSGLANQHAGSTVARRSLIPQSAFS